MTADRDVRDRLAEVIDGGGNEAAADAVLEDAGLLDAICEYRARQINADRSKLVGVVDVERFMAAAGFARAQMYREAAASVRLDHDERAQTIAVDMPRQPTKPEVSGKSRGLCPVCDRWMRLKADGTLRHHGGPKGSGPGWSVANRAYHCDGADQPPVEIREETPDA